MTNEADLRAWLSTSCPNVWSLLNQQARRVLPWGLVEYLSPLDQETIEALSAAFPAFDPDYLHKLAEDYVEQGRANLAFADKLIQELITACGSKAVGDAYRRDLSGVSTARQLAELLCEITLCASVSKRSSTLRLRPQSGKGTHCDVSFQLAGSTVYGEAKRYEDSWFSSLDSTRPSKRSLGSLWRPYVLYRTGVG